ncbi:hypothetical protein SELMODRAFT_416326 [Selaginella moellendorffii]|uniref:Uncharacterized protein n=1 Tax=Selaginella moellendorffii TaxID=88036 RepID=D8RYX9_SELML|nr:hypothetical protein SELMODRAFT_416326 [Selaginella moellendorffii]
MESKKRNAEEDEHPGSKRKQRMCDVFDALELGPPLTLCEEVLRLNAHMELKDLVEYPKRYELNMWFGEYNTSFIRTGLALQGTTNMIRLAQGLVEGPYNRRHGSPLHPVHIHEWLLFPQKIFQDGVQVEDHEMVIPPLNLCRALFQTALSRLYMMILLKMARKEPQYFLDEHEKTCAMKWLANKHTSR